MTDTEWIIKTPVAQPLGTVYVHLCSGEVLKIEDVDEIAMTEEHVIFTRGNLEAVIIERRDIYYSCQHPGDAPSGY